MQGASTSLVIILLSGFTLHTVQSEEFVANDERAEFKFGTATETSDQAEARCNAGEPSQLKDILFVVLSQNVEFHRQRVKDQRSSWEKLLNEERLSGHLNVLYTHEDWAPQGSWTILPLLPVLKSHDKASSAKWFFFCEDTTQVLSFKRLLSMLDKHNSCENQFLGRALQDTELAIIHHFADINFVYPDFAAGWLLSRSLLIRFADDVSAVRQDPQFSIDVSHEVAKYIHDKLDNKKLTNMDALCAGLSDEKASKKGCVTNVSPDLEDCGKVSLDDIFFGVKTTESFHKKRLNIMFKTWAHQLKIPDQLVLFSNVTDESIPTIDCGVPNTPRGHCGKLYAIFKYAKRLKKKRSWLVVTDDDTLLSIPRLQRLLACYDSSKPLVVGEVYGYGASTGHGSGYPTGGGGFILSWPAVKTLQESKCQCPGIDSPDDMILGQCIRYSGVTLVHRGEFHQARPSEYSPDFLARQTAVSFHRHYNHDPEEVFKKYLAD